MNDSLFQKVWKNSYIRYLIFKHLKLYNIFYKSRPIESLYNSNNNLYKYQSYINRLEIENYQQLSLYSIPSNVECIDYSNFDHNSKENSKLLPKWIKQLGIIDIDLELSAISHLSNLERLLLTAEEHIQEITSSSLPGSITHLYLLYYIFPIKRSTLPTRLKRLEIVLDNEYSYDDSDSSSEDSLEDDSYYEISPGSLPETLKEFKFFSIKRMIDLNRLQLPNSLTSLKIESPQAYSIPSNIQFPETLKELKIHCLDFNFQLPTRLKDLTLTCSNKFNSTLLPDSLDHLSLVLLNSSQVITTLPISLASLVLNCSSIYNQKGKPIFPNTLQTLLFEYDQSYNGFNQQLRPFTFPNSLTYLSFNSSNKKSIFNNGGHSLKERDIFPQNLTHLDFGTAFNQDLGTNILPESLKTLIFGQSFKKELNSNILPSNLNLIEIKNQYIHPLHFISSINPNTIIKCHNLHSYHSETSPNPELLKVLSLPSFLVESKLHLDNRVNLVYLDLSDQNISLLSEIPINNSIKTLVLGLGVVGPLNLEHFKQLETLIINDSNPSISIITKSTTFKSENGSIQDTVYQFYELKEIQVSSDNIQFLDSLNEIFYQFIKLK